MFWTNSNGSLLKSDSGFIHRSMFYCVHSYIRTVFHTTARMVGLSLMLLLLCVTLAHAAPQQEYLEARAELYTLLKSNTKQQYRHNWDKVLIPLHTFIDTYPQHSKTPSAYYLLGKGYSRLAEISHLSSDLDQAVNLLTKLEEKFPRSSLADDAMYLRAKLYLERFDDKKEAAQLCYLLLGRYPDGDMRPAAERLIERCGYTRAELKRAAASTLAPSTAGNFLTDIRHSITPERIRVVIETTTPAHFSAGNLTTPARIYVDITGVKNHANLTNRYPIEHSNSLLKTVRVGHDGTAARVVCDLAKDADYNVFTLDNPSRIVIDIANSSGPVVTAGHEELRAAPRATKDHVDTLLAGAVAGHVDMVSLPSKSNKNKRLCIVVDPGHGGKDPGAVGPNNLYEKDVTLAMGKRLAQTLRRHLDCDVHLTRTEDTYLTLMQRTAMANRLGADVFISVHVNASVNKSVRGTETYFLNFSKNDKAVEVAARENNMSLQEVGDLELILFDLMANSKINESSRLATEVQNSMVNKLNKRFSGIRDLGVRQGPFHVLLGADMPSILVEAAFVSNPQDAKLLRNNDFHATAVEGIAQGVKSYLRGQNMVAEN
ncbi:MAG: N-acetylmuramoyl-L-alanine amidase [Desulfuromonadaceae bacterium]|nr:N-acetylmuramoyl-L-alanine amidase [Desulfuromonadaceae bacterium]